MFGNTATRHELTYSLLVLQQIEVCAGATG